MTKVWKSRIWTDSFGALFIGYIIVYLIFSEGAIFMEIFAIQICLFWDFSKNPKNADIVRQITPFRKHPQFFYSFHLVAFSIGFAMVYSDFSVGAFLVKQFAKQNCQFSEFPPTILWGPFLLRANIHQHVFFIFQSRNVTLKQ